MSLYECPYTGKPCYHSNCLHHPNGVRCGNLPAEITTDHTEKEQDKAGIEKELSELKDLFKTFKEGVAKGDSMYSNVYWDESELTPYQKAVRDLSEAKKENEELKKLINSMEFDSKKILGEELYERYKDNIKENERLTEIEDCNKRTILSLKQEKGEIQSQLEEERRNGRLEWEQLQIIKKDEFDKLEAQLSKAKELLGNALASQEQFGTLAGGHIHEIEAFIKS